MPRGEILGSGAICQRGDGPKLLIVKALSATFQQSANPSFRDTSHLALLAILAQAKL